MPRINTTGYPGVYQNKTCTTYYYITYASPDLNIRKRTYVSGFNTAEEAYAAKIEREEETRRQILLARATGSIASLTSKYLEWKGPSLKANTAHHVALIINKYLSRPYGKCKVEDFCSEKRLTNFREKLFEHNISIGQKNKILHCIKDVFDYGSMVQIISNAQHNLIKVKTARFKANNVEHNIDKDNYWSMDEWRRFLSVIDSKNHWYVFFSLLGQLGCRIGEILGLQNKHFDPTTSTIRIEQQAQNSLGIGDFMITTPKTKSSVRTVTITPSMCEMLIKFQAHYKDSNPNNFLFFNTKRPQSRTTVRRVFNHYTNKAGLRHITLHGIRHSNCTWLLSDELSVQEIGQVSKRLGHASTRETLDVYLHIHKEENPIIINKLEKLV